VWLSSILDFSTAPRIIKTKERRRRREEALAGRSNSLAFLRGFFFGFLDDIPRFGVAIFLKGCT
jgi:hypothetical protein